MVNLLFVDKIVRVLTPIKSIEKMISSLKDVLELSGLYELAENEKLYTNVKEKNIKAIIPAAGEPNDIVKKEISTEPTCLLKIKLFSLFKICLSILFFFKRINS